jgi:hypothetical protein
MDANSDDWSQDGAEMRAKVEELEAKLKAHPGYLAKAKWDLIHRAHSIWVLNTNELLALLKVAETDDDLKVELFQNVREPSVRLAFFARLDQRLHNVVAAAVSLVDHTFVLRDHYPDSEFAKSFEDRNRKVADAPEAAFIRKLRNYLLHNGQVHFDSSLQIGPGDNGSDKMDLTLRINSSALLVDRADWNLASRTFIEGQPEGIDLGSVVNTYFAAMQDLYAWTFEQYEVLHHEDVDEMNAIVKEVNLTTTGGADDGTQRQGRLKHMQENLDRSKRGEVQVDWADVKDLPDYQ